MLTERTEAKFDELIVDAETEALVEELTAPPNRIAKKDKQAAASISQAEARGLLDLYYNFQTQRIRGQHQRRWIEAETEAPTPFIQQLIDASHAQEQWTGKLLRAWIEGQGDQRPHVAWALRQRGVGGILLAQILVELGVVVVAYIDRDGNMKHRPTVGHIWSFGGQDPSKRWGKKQKRPWNARLKRALYLLGVSFMKAGGFYGDLYRQRKAYELARNEAGEYAPLATAALEEKNYGRETIARAQYEQGKLPLARIDLRARRYAVKIFLAHLFEIAYRDFHGTEPPKPFALTQGGHAHYIAPPE